jgi:hypothetical protein
VCFFNVREQFSRIFRPPIPNLIVMRVVSEMNLAFTHTVGHGFYHSFCADFTKGTRNCAHSTSIRHKMSSCCAGSVQVCHAKDEIDCDRLVPNPCLFKTHFSLSVSFGTVWPLPLNQHQTFLMITEGVCFHAMSCIPFTVGNIFVFSSLCLAVINSHLSQGNWCEES